MRHLFGSIAVLAASILVLGCSDSDSDGDTKNGNNFDCSFAACGGDLVGKWKIKGTCLDTTGGGQQWESFPDCSDSVFSGNQEYTGTFTFKGNGTFTQDVQLTGSSRSVLDDDCLVALTAGTMTAEAFCNTMASTGGASSGTTMSCAYASGKCTCDTTFDIDFSVPGTYTTSGNKVAMTGWEDMGYCVAGNGEELKLNSDSGLLVLEKTDGGSGGSGGSGGDGGSGGNGGSGGSNGDACGFEACGGSYVGTWTAADVCVLTHQDFSGEPSCQGLPVQATIDVSGTLTYTTNTETSTLYFDDYREVFTLPAACVTAIAGGEYGNEETCQAIAYSYGFECNWSASSGCSCEGDRSGDWSWSDVPFEIRDNSMVFTGDDGEFLQPFCVEGSVQRQYWGGFILELTK